MVGSLSDALPGKQSRITRCLIRLSTALAFLCVVLANKIFKQHIRSPSEQSEQKKYATTANTTQCTPAQLSIIQQQLPADDCERYQDQPYTQMCSLVYATRCPDNSGWLGKYYSKLHSQPSPPPPFLGIFVGCNKGLDAVDAMRMGSGNPIFDKFVWKDAMTNHGRNKLGRDVCNQASVPQFFLPEDVSQDNNSTENPADNDSFSNYSSSSSQVHCIEPMPATAIALHKAAYLTRYDKMNFTVTHAAISRQNGQAPFPRSKKVGIENGGIGKGLCLPGRCMNVTMYRLDTYIEKFVPENMPINYLSVDVEGYDYEVLMGGTRNALSRVHYLEFEYNWMGPWKKQPLSQAIEHLDQLGLTCYWAGFNNTIWRITNCWLDQYDIHFWSNIACVNRNFEAVREIAEDMEKLFLETLFREDAVRDF
ncbi:hypothetical protein ACHAXR_001205, partial [Thalassiosira sp. AJA248-18]